VSAWAARIFGPGGDALYKDKSVLGAALAPAMFAARVAKWPGARTYTLIITHPE